MNELHFEKEFSLPGGKTSTAACVIPAYRGLPIHRDEIELGPREVELELQRRCCYYAAYQTVEDSAGINDMVNIDFQGYLGDQPFDDGMIEGFDLRLGSGTFVPGFEEQIMGRSAGETFTIQVTFPEEYPAEELKGQEASFTITVNEVKHLTVPSPSDEVAQKQGYSDLAELTESIRRHRIQLHRARQDDKLEEELLERVINSAQTVIPEPLMAFTMGQLERQLQRKLSASRTSRKQFLLRNSLTEETLQEQLRQRSVNAVTKQLVVDAITQQEQLMPTAQEIDAELEEFQKKSNGKRPQKSPQLRTLMQERICCRKVGAFLLDYAVEEA